MGINIVTGCRIIRLAAVMVCICMTAVFPMPSAAEAEPAVLIVRTKGKDFEAAVRGIRQEVDDELRLIEMIIDRSTDVRHLVLKMERKSPSLIVLMDNISISLFRKYQAGLPVNSEMVPSISLMSSFTDIAIRDLKNASGIFYEVPVVTSVVSLRSILPGVRIQKVGVIHRDMMESSVRINRMYCRKEKIELVSIPISGNDHLKSELEEGLALLKKKVDALWVLNDSRLLNTELLGDVWQPFARDFRKPLIVGVEVLVQPKFRFGTFGVIPDHTELGVQAAEMIFDIMENEWQAEEGRVEQPRSVYKILNLDQAVHVFKIQNNRLSLVDKVLR